MKSIILITLLIYANAFADSLVLSNKVRFFEKESFASAVTNPMCDFFDIDIKLELPSNTALIQKVYEQEILCNDFKGKFQLFYHQRNGEKYLSQQILINNQNDEIAFCSSYFSMDAKFLVPCACVGSFNKKSIGISVFK